MEKWELRFREMQLQEQENASVAAPWNARVRHLSAVSLASVLQKNSAWGTWFAWLRPQHVATASVGLLAFLGIFFTPATAYEVQPSPNGLVTIMRGTDSILLHENTAIESGDAIQVGSGRSRAYLRLGDGSVTALAHAQFVMNDVLELQQGDFQLYAEDVMPFRTPTAMLQLQPNTRAQVRVSSSGTVETAVQQGSVMIEKEGRQLALHAGQFYKTTRDSVLAVAQIDIENPLSHRIEERLMIMEGRILSGLSSFMLGDELAYKTAMEQARVRFVGLAQEVDPLASPERTTNEVLALLRTIDLPGVLLATIEEVAHVLETPPADAMRARLFAPNAKPLEVHFVLREAYPEYALGHLSARNMARFTRDLQDGELMVDRFAALYQAMRDIDIEDADGQAFWHDMKAYLPPNMADEIDKQLP